MTQIANGGSTTNALMWKLGNIHRFRRPKTKLPNRIATKVWISQQVIYSERTSGQLLNSSHPLWVGLLLHLPKVID